MLPIFYVLKNFHRKIANLMAPPTDITTKRLVTCKSTSSNSRRKQRPYRCITGDAIFQTGKKLTKKCRSEFGTLQWRRLTPQGKTAIWVHNYNHSRVSK